MSTIPSSASSQFSAASPLRPDYDVIVVGARAAGAATAMLLARQGARVLVVDRSSFGADTLSTHALMRAGVLQLTRWGLLQQVIDADTPPIARTTFTYGDDSFVVNIKPSHGVDALYAPRRTVLDPILVAAASSAGAEFHYGVTFTDVVRSRGRVTGITGVTGGGALFEGRARLVIGADGVRSSVAQRVGAPFTRLGTGASAVSYGYWSGMDTDGYEWIFRPNAAAGVIPTNDGEACVFASALPERIGRGGRDVITDIVAQASPELAQRFRAATAPAGTRSWAGKRGHIRQSWGPGWALVGDAGYFKDPLSAHGLTDALRDAELLARAVLATLRGDAGEADALAHYQLTRDTLSLPLFDVVDRIAGHQWTDATIGDLLLQLSAAMADEVDTLAQLDTRIAA